MIRKIGEAKGSRVVIIGLDGASFNYLGPILKSGGVPNFQRFMERGFAGDCLSTIPPLTPPAWSTMLTGVNPGKHGVFDFLQPDEGGAFRMVDANFRRRRSFLDRAKADGIRTISVLVPYTFPPDPETNGLTVAGLGTPSAESDFIRPHDFRDKLLKDFPFLKEVDPTKNQSLETLATGLRDFTAKTVELTKRAMKELPDWGICFTVFQATDLIPHFYSKYFDPDHPEYAQASKEHPEYKDSLADIYKAIDPFLGECMDMMEKDGGWVVIVSDHGSQPLSGSIGKDAFLARWLEDEGYLVTGGEKGRAKQAARARAGSAANRLLYLAKQYTPHGIRDAFNRMLGRKKGEIHAKLTKVPFLEDIVWEKTKAFCAPGGYGVGLYINREGDFPGGIVSKGAEYHEVREKIRAGLKKLEIAEGVPLFNEVLAREEAMWGPEVKLAPDLLLLWREDPRLAKNNYTLTDGRKLEPPEIKAGGRLRWCGTHRMEGLFGIAGEGVRGGAKMEKPVNLADVMPTVLYVAGMEVPSDLDGRIMAEAFEEEWVKGKPPMMGAGEGEEKKSGEVMSEGDSEKLLDLLEGLGYLN